MKPSELGVVKVALEVISNYSVHLLTAKLLLYTAERLELISWCSTAAAISCYSSQNEHCSHQGRSLKQQINSCCSGQAPANAWNIRPEVSVWTASECFLPTFGLEMDSWQKCLRNCWFDYGLFRWGAVKWNMEDLKLLAGITERRNRLVAGRLMWKEYMKRSLCFCFKESKKWLTLSFLAVTVVYICCPVGSDSVNLNTRHQRSIYK